MDLKALITLRYNTLSTFIC